MTPEFALQRTPFQEHGVSSLKFQVSNAPKGSLKIEYLKESKSTPSVLSARDMFTRREMSARNRPILCDFMMLFYSSSYNMIEKQ